MYRFVDLSDSTLQHGSTNTSSCCPLAQNNHFLKHGTPETETHRSQERKEKSIRPCKIWHPFRDRIIYRHGKDALFRVLRSHKLIQVISMNQSHVDMHMLLLSLATKCCALTCLAFCKLVPACCDTDPHHSSSSMIP